MTRGLDSLADWFVGGAGKRRLLAALTAASPGDRFTQKELADTAQLHKKGSVVRHLQVLEHAGVLQRDGPRGAYVVCAWAQRDALANWLRELHAAEQASAEWQTPLPPGRTSPKS
jgi:DNA-binding IclR family transcriptional regulator